MSDLYQNPEQRPAPYLAPDTAISPDASDFIEQPDMDVVPPQRESLPVWLYLICGIALFLAGSSYTGLQFGPGYYDQGEGGLAINDTNLPPPETPDDPMSIGKRLYNGNCANCHQASGAGQPGIYPPMVGSEWVLGSKQTLASILLDGVSGPINVHGGAFGTGVMPPWAANFSDSNLAALMTYIRKSWGNNADEVKPEEVAPVRTKDASRSTPWTEPDLTKMNSSGGK